MLHGENAILQKMYTKKSQQGEEMMTDWLTKKQMDHSLKE